MRIHPDSSYTTSKFFQFVLKYLCTHCECMDRTLVVMKGVKIVTDTLNCAILSTRTARNNSFTTLVWCATSWDSSTVEWYMLWWCHECVQCVTLQRRHNIVGQHTKTISTLHQLVWRWLLVAFMAVRPQLGLCSACLKPVFLAYATSATCVLMMMKWRWDNTTCSL